MIKVFHTAVILNYRKELIKMTQEEYLEKLRVCPFNDEDCLYYDRQFYMCNRLATIEPEMFMLTYCIKCEEE